MSKIKVGWVVFLVLLYGGFWIWYGGNGNPLPQAEGEAILRKMEKVYGVTIEEAPEGSLISNLAAMPPNDDGNEFYAVNLETRKKGAAALKAEARYGEIVIPLLFKRGGHPVFVGERAGLMLGQYGNEIDRVGVVRYRSLRDLMDMTLDPEMLKGREFKYAALEHTEVFITRPTLTFVQVRLMAGLIFLTIGFAGFLLIRRRPEKSSNLPTSVTD